ncbi:MAG: NAD(P)-binding domain-containing protein [Bacteroidales bacterium]|nr:NAD(P)-binding domain-containing protein [Bacteroidales bacterium]
MKKKILLGSHFIKEIFAPLEKDFELIYPEGELFSKEEILEKIADADVLVPGIETDQEILDKAKKLRLIANFGAGYDCIDVEYATQKGITITNTPHAVLEPTAELCFGLMITAGRRISFYDRKLRTKEGLGWGMYDDLGTGLYGKTLGIFGMGKIGQAVARRAYASGMKIIYHNRKPLSYDIAKKYEARYVGFDELLAQADFLSLNAPATDETHHLMNEETFGKMKSSAIFINAARGSLVDEKALIQALKNKVISGAGLDVFENEPNIPEGFKTLDNVVITPHVGTQTLEAKENMQKEVMENILGFFNNGKISKVN